MGRAMVLSDSESGDDDCQPDYKSIEIRIQISPQKRRANDKKPTEAKKRRAGPKVSEEAIRPWKCGMCGLSYTKKGNLVRHEKKAHFGSQQKTKCQKRGRPNSNPSNLARHVKKAHLGSQENTKWMCQKCGNHYSSSSHLALHVNKKHSSESPITSDLTECRLCNLEYNFLQKHYEEHHSIRNVEDMLFNDGTVLVISGSDTENGTATWFLSQKQKATRRLNALKCRLCESEPEYDSENLLKQHYIADHQVDKDYLSNIGHLFRIEKGGSDVKDRKLKSVPKHHRDGTADNSQTSLNNCDLCGKNYNPLCKHYSTVHGIDDVKDILFETGNVLILSSANTENGKAAWFVKQLEIANKRLNDRKCRLCEIQFSNKKELEDHYTGLSSNSGHHIHPAYLWKLKLMFRKEKKAHLKEKSDDSGRSKRASEAKAAGDTVNKSKKKVDGNIKSKRKGQPEHIQEMGDGVITYKCKCGVATETYDASVNHAQTHLVSGYTLPTTKCPRCDLTFEELWLEDHVSRHGNEDGIALKVINYDPTTLLSSHNKWFDMFSTLSDTAHAEKIVASSIYKHTRCLKMSWDVRQYGVPLYQCGTCKLFVDPVKVANHMGTCRTGKLQEHCCSKCRISFSTDNALKKHVEHEDDHEIGKFKIVTFNNKTDVPFNKALMQQQSSSEEEFGESSNDEDRVMEFCNKCQRSVNNFNEHSTAHKNEAKKTMDAISRQENMSMSIGKDAVGREIEQEEQVSYGNNYKMNTNVNEKDVQNPSNFEVSKDGTCRMEIDSRDTVIAWESDSESVTTEKIQAQINVSTKNYERNNMEQVFYVSGKDAPGEENDEDISEVTDFNDLQDEILTAESRGLNIYTSQADIQAEAESAENDNVVVETQQKDNITLNNKKKHENASNEDGVIGENNQETNEMNFWSEPELYLRQGGGANENDTEELDANKDAELQSTQDLLQTLEGTEHKDQSPRICTNDEVAEKPVTTDITLLLPVIRLLADLATKK